MGEIDSSFLNPNSTIKKAIRIEGQNAGEEKSAEAGKPAPKMTGDSAHDFVAMQNYMQDEVVRLNEEIHSLNEEKQQLQQKLEVEVAELEKSLKERVDTAEGELEIIRNEFHLFAELVDGLLEKLPAEAIEEFSNSEDAKFYKSVVTKHLQ